jgi:hypothetical protein
MPAPGGPSLPQPSLPQPDINCSHPLPTHSLHLPRLLNTWYTVLLKEKTIIITSHYGAQRPPGNHIPV